MTPRGDQVIKVGTLGGGGRRQDWAQVYSTVHVSPVWLGGWRRGPVGVTTEAGVCKGWEEGGGVVRGGEVKEEGEEEKDRGKGGPSTCPGPRWGPAVPPDGPSVISHALPSAPPLGPSLRRLPPALAARELAGVLFSLTLNLLT